MRIVIADTENGVDRDVSYEDFPNKVITQYFSKEGETIGLPQTHHFLTLASYLLWVIDIASTLTPLSEEYSNFAYFAATRPNGKELVLENRYVRRSYTFNK